MKVVTKTANLTTLNKNLLIIIMIARLLIPSIQHHIEMCKYYLKTDFHLNDWLKFHFNNHFKHVYSNKSMHLTAITSHSILISRSRYLVIFSHLYTPKFFANVIYSIGFAIISEYALILNELR